MTRHSEHEPAKGTIHRSAAILAAICLPAGLIMVLSGSGAQAGPFFITFFVALGTVLRGHPALKGFSFTVMILGVVTTALYYPDAFVQWGDFQTSNLIIPLLQLIMFGMGATMSVKAFLGVVRQPKGVAIGFVLQFTIMPLVGFTLATLSGFPPEVAAGIILVGCSPSGLASNVMAYLGKGNVPLSLTITSVNTLFAPLMTPLLMGFLAGTFVEIDTTGMMWDIMRIVIVPVVGGIVFHEFLSARARWVNDALPVVSMAGIGLIILITTAMGRDSLLDLGLLLFAMVLAHNVTGYFLGYWSARLLKMNETDCRTIAIEVGMQNAGLGKGIAQAMGKLATLGLAPLVFGPVMNVTGSMLAMYWHGNPPKDALDLPTFIEARNRFAREMLTAGRFTPAQLDGRWSDSLAADFASWSRGLPELPDYDRRQVQELQDVVADYALSAPRRIK
jgi:bile acid:Na+ symporter, BASS family